MAISVKTAPYIFSVLEAKSMNKLNEHYAEARKMFAEDRIVGIFLSGNQNYGLDDEYSDIDTKLIITPSINDFIYNNSPISYTHVFPNGEHMEVKDIRCMFQCYRKQNINFVETLFTKYYILNPTYADDFSALMNNEAVAHYNEEATLCCVREMMETYYRQLSGTITEPLSSTLGYNPKKLDTILRLAEFADKYINSKAYIDCITPDNAEYHKSIKRGHIKKVEIAYALALNTKQYADKLINNYLNNHSFEKNKEIDELFNSSQANIIKKSLQLEGIINI